MRCPRCAYKGKLFQGKCAVCGYPLEQEAQEMIQVNTADVQQPFLQMNDQYSPATTNSTPIFDAQPTSAHQSTNRYISITNHQTSNNHPPTHRLEAGTTLHNGRYRLQNRITLPASQQSYGLAWNAYDLQMASRFVVIREVNFSNASTPQQKEFLANKIAQQLNRLGEHPGLPRVSDMFSVNESYFLVFHYPSGETLTILLKRWRNGLPEYMIAKYLWQLCDILASLEQQQPPIVHGAISPETILISEEGEQAILMHLPLLPPKEPSEKIDDPTSFYRAPEQIHGTITPASDLYSLAATLYYAVTGADPQERPPAFYPPARRLNPAVSPAMELILARELRLTVAQRYSSPQEMQQDVEALLESYATQATRAVTPLQPSEIPLLSLKIEKNWKTDLKDKKIIIPALLGILVILVLFIMILLHA